MNYIEYFEKGKRELNACVSQERVIGCYSALIARFDKSIVHSKEQKRQMRITLGEHATILMRKIVDNQNTN